MFSGTNVSTGRKCTAKCFGESLSRERLKALVFLNASFGPALLVRLFCVKSKHILKCWFYFPLAISSVYANSQMFMNIVMVLMKSLMPVCFPPYFRACLSSLCVCVYHDQRHFKMGFTAMQSKATHASASCSHVEGDKNKQASFFFLNCILFYISIFPACIPTPKVQKRLHTLLILQRGL